MKIYTRTGDAGDTGLFGGARVRKDAPRVEAYGTVDELNASIGMARAVQVPSVLDPVLRTLQDELFCLGAELATQPGHEDRLSVPRITSTHVQALEEEIDRHQKELPELRTFILPGGSPAGAALHVARTVCRRAERRTLALDDVRPELVTYLNRLSDLLFVLARRACHLAETEETPWMGRLRS